MSALLWAETFSTEGVDVTMLGQCKCGRDAIVAVRARVNAVDLWDVEVDSTETGNGESFSDGYSDLTDDQVGVLLAHLAGSFNATHLMPL